MSNSGYDLDTSGGLMPLIRALIKPPDEDANASKPKRTQHPYYKRPGRGHNHDCCDACQEGGDLICCDRCPASFHLGCHDPPLEEQDIPLGQWLCLECRSAGERPRAASPCTSHRSFESDKKARSLRVNRSNSCVSSTSSTGKREREVLEPDTPPEPEEPPTPMEVLVRAARIMNPRQFQLPREMQVDCPFPGTDKVEKNGSQKAVPYARDATGCVPLPARLCFHCRTSCRAAPLLQCDYCPLLYHQDCLDPPLTALPSGRWMCPNHVEQYIDWQLVNSISASERVALWARLGGPVDQDAVRLEFTRRARRRRPPFRVRLPAGGPRGRVRVPAMVRHHYRQPPPLLPTRRDTVRCHALLKSNRNFDTSLDEDDGKKRIICMNLHCPRYLTKNSACEHEENSDDSLDERDVVAEEDLKAISESTVESAEEKIATKRRSDSVSMGDSADEMKSPIKIAPKRRKTGREVDDPDEEVTCNGKIKIEEDVESINDTKDEILGVIGEDAKEMKEILFSVEEQIKKIDSRLVKMLAFQRLQQILGPDGDDDNLDDTVADIITKSIDKSSLRRYGFRHVALPSELLTRAEVQRIARAVGGAVAARDELQRLRRAAPAPTPAVAHGLAPACPAPQPPRPSLSALPVRATLCPVERPSRNGLGDGFGRPVPMRLSRLTVGLSGCDLSLQNYGSCRYVSDRHALIFYDEVTHHFELINYSEFGTCINGQLYSCDFTERTRVDTESAGTGTGLGAEGRAAALRAIAAKRQGRAVVDNNLSMSPAREWGSRGPCGCSGAASLVAGWEGAALLPHGALLKFGCIMFVFSITDPSYLSEGQ